ncbi:uncharacterized protein LOC111613481 [Centruroides sculpturatus]|uniref:uncharacterized protein LOC111613481 n=1 Tax=Centruroides sculpturatus TaxID=218467 RepID=UPI000C6D4DF7|nr:uncharacterized protein LOC111613481 [Centruroides sculpturatus]
MATIGQIENFRYIRGKNISSICVCGKRQAWTDYYGGPACKNCIEFFIYSIRMRKDYVCVNMNGLCKTDVQADGFKCDYCHLQILYKIAQLKPKMYGRYEDRWYMKDMIPYLPRREVNGIDVLRICLEDEENELNIMSDFNIYYSRCCVVLHRTRCTEDIGSIAARNLIMDIITESLHCHDVLKSYYRFIDPYKMKSLGFHNKLIPHLEMTRRFLEIVEDDYPTREQIYNYVFLGIPP